MNKVISAFGFLAAGLVACGGVDAGVGTAAQQVVLDIRCDVDTDCPTNFECEEEAEHGVVTSYCVSHDGEGAVNGECPAGYELEAEHEGTFCKPHDGSDDGAGGSDDGVGGGDDGAGGGGATAGSACTTNADCAPGLECETELEHGATTASCKEHGGSN